jgi:SAM-dependent methyltransferase
MKSELAALISNWELSDNFKLSLVERENYFCSNCSANYRMRVHAESIFRLYDLGNTYELIQLLENKNFTVYETAAYSIFRSKSIKNIKNYIVSEYFDNAAFGSYVDGIRNENLECLSFSDNSFDVVVNSDVLEHVSNLDKALSEIKRVLKPGGYHVFTLPVDYELGRTVERARIVNGKVEHLKKPVMHGDTIRGEGILAFRDFGSDVLDYLRRDGFECEEFKYVNGGQHITSVYYAQKAC